MNRWAFAVAALSSLAVILSAPFAGQMRAWMRSAFPGSFAAIVTGGVVAAIACAVAVAAARIRQHRLRRYSAILAALVLGIVQGAAFSTGIAEVDSVERVHFIEYGLITLLFYRAWRPLGDASMLVMPVLAGLLVGTLEEWLQWFIPNRIGEARDVLLNLSAIGSGLLFSLGLDPPDFFSWRPRRGSLGRIGIASAAVLLVFALFVHAVHLGHDVTGEGVGTFRSRHRADELEALAQDRAARWPTDPPLVLRRLSREDQYMDEGLWHVRRRNEAWAEGDYRTAWYENRILEEYFAPVLDTPSYVSATGHRWPVDQRADGERRHAGNPAPYVSDAQPYPVMTWSRPAFWTTVSAISGLLVLSFVLVERRRPCC